MSVGLTQLKKLRSRSLNEIRARSLQELSKLSERLFGTGTSEMDDAALLSEITPSARNGSGKGSVAPIMERIRSFVAGAPRASQSPIFFPALARLDRIVELVKQRFPCEARLIIERADHARACRFDLLGYKDLSFGSPIEWVLEPVSGKRTPLDHWSRIDYLSPDAAGDKKITWELNRHAHFVTFGQAYALTGDERYAASFVAQASAWMDNNPPNRGINWASSLELSFRVMAWLWALHFMAGSRHLTNEFAARFIKYLIAHGRHIESYLSYYFSPNTHLTGEALGLFYLGVALPELRKASAWRKTGLRILVEQLPIQVRADGGYFEQSTYYHRYTADFYIHLMLLTRANNWLLPARTDDRLAAAINYLMWITRPDGSTPFIGDDDGGRLIAFAGRAPNDFRDTLAAGAALFGSGDWKFVAGEARSEIAWLLGPEGIERYDRIKTVEPVQHSRAFSDSGYFVMREGWDEHSSYALIDCGPHGAHNCGHAHADALSFEFAASGVTWLVDPGTFSYTGDREARDYFRSTAAHNTVEIDGQSQSVPAGPFSWNHIARSNARDFIGEKSFDYFEGSHDGYKRLSDPVTHNRAMLMVKPEGESEELPAYMIVHDWFAARGHHRYSAAFHFGRDCEVSSEGSSITALAAGERALEIKTYAAIAPSARIEQGWVSGAYGHREEAPVARVEIEGKGDQELITLLMPSSAGRAIRIERRESTNRGGVFKIAAECMSDIAIVGSREAEARSERVSAQGAFAVARFRGEDFDRGFLIEGKKIEIANLFALTSPTSVRSCTVRAREGNIEITIHGGTRFDLSFSHPPEVTIINGVSYDLGQSRRGAAFVREGSGWRLIESEKDR
ncbi:MAG TPA: alginate lyase family protein [Blastocatellia bacterium]